MLGGFFKKEESLSELEEKDEKLEVELSVAQKQRAIAELKKRGLAPKHFGKPPDFKRIINWLKTH